MTLGKRETVRRALRALRATVDLSQRAVAECLGIPEQRYWRIENGYDQPTDKERTAIAKVFGVNETQLPWSALEAKAS